MKNKTLLRIKFLSKKIGKTLILDQVDMNLTSGNVYGLLGKNGSGKTTLLYTIVGIYNAESGSQIWVDGELCEIGQLRSRISLGFASQEIHLLKNITVDENILFFSKLLGVNRGDFSSRIKNFMEYFEIDDLRQRKVITLSMGEIRKVQILCSLLHNPALLILDEPFINIDDIAIERLQNVFKELASNGTTVLFTSHNLMVIESVSDRIGILQNGRMIFEGDIKEILSSFATTDKEYPLGHKLQIYFRELIGNIKPVDDSLNWL